MEDRWFLPSGAVSAADRLFRADGHRPHLASWLYHGLLHVWHLAADRRPSRERSRPRSRDDALPRGGPDPFVRRIPQVSERWLAEHSRRAGMHGQPP